MCQVLSWKGYEPEIFGMHKDTEMMDAPLKFIIASYK